MSDQYTESVQRVHEAARKDMLRVMCKYVLLPGTASYDMPAGAVIKSAGFVAGEVVVWALVNPPSDIDAPVAMRAKTITCAMTGELMSTFLITFIGTVVRPDGIVVHVFEQQR